MKKFILALLLILGLSVSAHATKFGINFHSDPLGGDKFVLSGDQWLFEREPIGVGLFFKGDFFDVRSRLLLDFEPGLNFITTTGAVLIVTVKVKDTLSVSYQLQSYWYQGGGPYGGIYFYGMSGTSHKVSINIDMPIWESAK